MNQRKGYICIKSVEGFFTEGTTYMFSFDEAEGSPHLSEDFLNEHFIPIEKELEGSFTGNDQMRELLVQFTDKLQQTLLKKNLDYGNSYEKTYNKRGNAAIMIRLEDKLERLDQLLTNDKKQNVSDESIDDTLLDLAGYAILALAVRSK